MPTLESPHCLICDGPSSWFYDTSGFGDYICEECKNDLDEEARECVG